MSFYNFPERNATILQKYLIEKINHGIKSEEKSFKPELISQFLQALGWDFQILNEYVHNISAYKGIKRKTTLFNS